MWIYPNKREKLPRTNVDLVNLLQGKATLDVEFTHHECRSFVESKTNRRGLLQVKHQEIVAYSKKYGWCF
jgi:hypothetical protein